MSRYSFVSDELVDILERQARDGATHDERVGATIALIGIELRARTGCWYGCSERGVSTYCPTHYTKEA